MEITTLGSLLSTIVLWVVIGVLIFRATKPDKGQKNDGFETFLRILLLSCVAGCIIVTLVSFLVTKKSSPICQERGAHDFSQITGINDVLNEEYPIYSSDRVEGIMFEHGSLVSTKGYKVCYMKNGESICEDYADYDIITHYVSENPRIEFHTKYYNSQVCEVCGKHLYTSSEEYYVLYLTEE